MAQIVETSAPAAARVREFAAAVGANVAKVMVGKAAEVELLLVALLAEGHVLLEDVPGVGKTTLIRALARSLDCQFRRVQFTPDLLPSDVTGLSFFNQKHSEFEFRPGPIFAQIVLADEINRATPRAQSALLEAMQERTVTLDGETRRLPRPFLVLATQNPVELEGTFPLPEAQLDRFLLKLELGYPSAAEEEAMVLRFEREDPFDALAPVVGAAQVSELQQLTRTIELGAAVRGYLVALTRATRELDELELGASPRGSLALARGAQALAALRGRGFVLPDDVKALVQAVLGHRLILTPEARMRGLTAAGLLRDVLARVPVPVEDL
ncbi:MAG TPA: AAA family ATPase [Herpetosiphonaceae bacterium]